ncbi:MAG: class I SAM-dependent methyltransferase [Candidatus Wallbacteria bacterium]|nr:class I SAM-dependent methyltransferase [Candidatus Wallbacteria bacterium]
MEESKRVKILQFVQNALLFGDSVVVPTHIDRHLMAFADEEFGQNWIEAQEVVDVLATGLRSILQSRGSTEPPAYDLGSLMAHLFGIGPLHFHKVPFLLRNLLRKSVFKNQLRILDLGAGVGISTLSTIYFFELLANSTRLVTGVQEEVHLTFTALDSLDEALRLYQKHIQGYRPVFPEVQVDVASPIQATLSPDPDSLANTLGRDRYDLILASHVLGEMRKLGITQRAKLLAELGKYLEPGGSILFAESASSAIPSEMNQLKARAVGEGLTLFAPCSNAWEKPTGRQCYSCGNVSFEKVRRPNIADIIGTVCEDYSFDQLAANNSWVFGILRADDVIHHSQLEIGSGLFTKLAASPQAENGRATVYGAVAKLEVGRVDNEPYFKLCDQTCGSDVAWLKFAPEVGVPALENGDVLELENVSVVPAKGGKNKVFLVVDGETRMRNLSRDFRLLPSKHVLTQEVVG